MSPYRPPVVEVDVDAIRAAEDDVKRRAHRLNRIGVGGITFGENYREYVRALEQLRRLEQMVRDRPRHGVMCSCRACVERWGAL